MTSIGHFLPTIPLTAPMFLPTLLVFLLHQVRLELFGQDVEVTTEEGEEVAVGEGEGLGGFVALVLGQQEHVHCVG